MPLTYTFFVGKNLLYFFLSSLFPLKKLLTNFAGDDKIICVADEQQNALVAQLDRVSDYESEGQGFESLRARQRKGIRFIRVPFLLPYHKGTRTRKGLRVFGRRRGRIPSRRVPMTGTGAKRGWARQAQAQPGLSPFGRAKEKASVSYGCLFCCHIIRDSNPKGSAGIWKAPGARSFPQSADDRYRSEARVGKAGSGAAWDKSLRARQRKGIRFIRVPFLLPYHKGLEPERVCGYLEGAGGAFLPAECR